MTLNRWPWLNARKIKPVQAEKILKFWVFAILTLTWILWWSTSIPTIRSVGQLVWRLSARNRIIFVLYCYDLDLWPVTLILKLYLDIVMTYFCTKNEVNRSIGSKVINWKQRQTDRQDTCETFTYPLSLVVKMSVQSEQVWSFLYLAKVNCWRSWLRLRSQGQGQCYNTDTFWTLNCWKREVCSQSERISSLIQRLKA